MLTFRIYFIIFVLSFLLSCKKDSVKVVPTITISVINFTETFAKCGGEITSDGGAEVEARGFCWDTIQNPTTINYKTTDGSGIGSFTRIISGLSPGTTYNIRAYAVNTEGTGYSSQTTFTTLASTPVLVTEVLSQITSSSVKSGGNITSDGGTPITVRGICWSNKQNPTISDNLTVDGKGIGSFSSSISGLLPGVTYYFRAYATNSVGTSYGNQVTTTTLAPLPILITTTVSTFTSSTAISGGNITSDGGLNVIARGVCWSMSQNPTTVNNKTTDGIGTGSFSSSITGLTPGATYYIKAYATNSSGTAYGDQVTVTTTAILPVITTTKPSSILTTTILSGGNITNDGGAEIIARGVCWSTSQNPTISNFKTMDGSGIGSFNSNLTDLSENTTYYLKAYATNSIGTGYGSQVSFITLPSSSLSVTDIDGNVYHTVTIGTQVWMVENLKTTKYRNGVSIPKITDGLTWVYLTTGAYCNYNNDENKSTIYGRLYNWSAVSNIQNIAPKGWHVPTSYEWDILSTYLGGTSVAGGKLKETGTAHWQSPNTGATNETGFSALPGGNRSNNGVFDFIGFYGGWWASNYVTPNDIYHLDMHNGNSSLSPNIDVMVFGLSVRCVKD